MFNEPYMRQLFKALNPNYDPPDRRTIGGSILNNCYSEIQRQVNVEFSQMQYINVIFDESTNIRNHRVFNISLSDDTRSFYYTSEIIQAKRLDAHTIARLILDKLEELLPVISSWKNINSFATNTCSTMRKVWKIIQQDKRIPTVFCIPCDFHGLQLVIKDLLDLRSIGEVFLIASSIISHFRSSPKQYAAMQNVMNLEGPREPMPLATQARVE
jgi:hypothetical protein